MNGVNLIFGATFITISTLNYIIIARCIISYVNIVTLDHLGRQGVHLGTYFPLFSPHLMFQTKVISSYWVAGLR